MYLYQVIMLYTLDLYHYSCQLFLSKFKKDCLVWGYTDMISVIIHPKVKVWII